MSVAIFVGPTFPFGQITNHLQIPATILPPIKRGDIEEIQSKHEIIVIIDGVFHSTLSVSAREILLALRENKIIYGCSSMGALRAAELDKLGMIGVGKVYEMYANRTITSDGEVALLFDPVTYENMTIPLVNVRFGISQAVKQKIITQSIGSHLLMVASQIHYTELDYLSLIKKVSQDATLGACDKLYKFFIQCPNNLDLKKLDAIHLIEKLNLLYR